MRKVIILGLVVGLLLSVFGMGQAVAAEDSQEVAIIVESRIISEGSLVDDFPSQWVDKEERASGEIDLDAIGISDYNPTTADPAWGVGHFSISTGGWQDSVRVIGDLNVNTMVQDDPGMAVELEGTADCVVITRDGWHFDVEHMTDVSFTLIAGERSTLDEICLYLNLTVGDDPWYGGKGMVSILATP